MDVKESMRAILEAESRAIAGIPVTDEYERAVGLIVEHVHRRGGKLITSGMGKAGQIAMNIATTFSSTGTPAVSLHPAEAQHGDLGVMQPDDVMLLISNSGKTSEIVELVNLARGLFPQVPLIVISGQPDSPLDHDDDRHRRRAGGERDGAYRLLAPGICQAPPRRLSGSTGRREKLSGPPGR